MAACTLDQFNEYTGNLEEDDNGLKQIYLDSAEQIIIDYLGYDFNENDYEEYLKSNGLDYVQLSAIPITTLTSVTIDGEVVENSKFSIKRDLLVYSEGVIPVGVDVAVEYTAGYATIPGVIKLVELQIAGLLFSEANGNIGVTSKSFDQGNTRTFFKTTNFEPYLTKLSSIRLQRYD